MQTKERVNNNHLASAI